MDELPEPMPFGGSGANRGTRSANHQLGLHVRELDDYPFDLNQDEQKELRINPEGIITNVILHVTDLEERAAALYERHGLDDLVSLETFLAGANLAIDEHLLNLGQYHSLLDDAPERAFLAQQKSLKLWKDPKDQILTLAVCCLASLTQGWQQVSNGNLGWPHAFGLDVNENNPANHDSWIFGVVNAIMWWSAAVSALLITDPLQSHVIGRRGALVIAGVFSFASTIGASQTHSWKTLLLTKALLGIGIGAKASVVPVLESEFLPAGKRGPFLCTWQTFTATGIFMGSVAVYILRFDWRAQVLSGALPALVFLTFAMAATESPRWLLSRNKKKKALENLIRLRGSQTLACKDWIFIEFQTQMERWLYANTSNRLPYLKRVGVLVGHPRYRRAGIASAIAMFSQQLSGVNIFAFLSSTFFSTAGLEKGSSDETVAASLRIGIGFGLLNMIFSAVAFFFIDPLDADRYPIASRLRGRRFLLLLSLSAGAIILLATALSFNIQNSHRAGTIIAFVYIFAMFYSPGAGCIPFLYSSEVWGNESRELGMSWAVFCNFVGAGLVALFTPLGLKWGHGKFLGLFCGFSVIGWLLVYFFLPSTDFNATVEEMIWTFGIPFKDHARDKLRGLNPIKWEGPVTGDEHETEVGSNESVHDVEPPPLQQQNTAQSYGETRTEAEKV